MKKYKVPLIIVSFLLIGIIGLISVLIIFGKDDYVKYEQNIDYTESIQKINNPDQGFYKTLPVKMEENKVTYSNYVITNDARLYHLRVDISKFSSKTNGLEDKPLTEESLTGLENLLSLLQEKEKNAIIRFSYDANFGGKANLEPEFEMIINHVSQVCQVLNKFKTTLTAVEVGMIGPWGEMHTSTIANKTYISPLIDKFLTETQDIAILVRTPQMIYNYLNISINDIENYEIDKNSKAYRLGIFNDGYLGSNSDLGTYTQREKEIDFLSKQTSHLPYGGEVVIPNSNLHDIENCLPEMNTINLNYLNVEWNNQVIDKWKNTYYTSDCGQDQKYYNQTAFTYIENHLGYRFVLKNSTFYYSAKSKKFKVNLTLDNVGFGNLNKSKKSKLIFINEKNEVVLKSDVANFNGEKDFSFSTSLNLSAGEYKVYLCLYGEEKDNQQKYTLQFANNNIWNSELCANHIGSINLK